LNKKINNLITVLAIRIVLVLVVVVLQLKNTPSERGFHSLVGNKGISKVDCSHIVIEMVKAVPTYGTSGIGDCGFGDLLPAGCILMAETVMMHQGIFENALAEEWIEQEKELQACSEIIDHVIKVCDFPADSIMVKFIDQQQWSTLEHAVSVGFDEVGEFFTVRDDGISFEDTPMLTHL
jgi:hypothetical protein